MHCICFHNAYEMFHLAVTLFPPLSFILGQFLADAALCNTFCFKLSLDYVPLTRAFFKAMENKVKVFFYSKFKEATALMLRIISSWSIEIHFASLLH